MDFKEAFGELEQTIYQLATHLNEQPAPSAEDRRNLALLRFLTALLKSVQEGRSYKIGWNLSGMGDYTELDVDTSISNDWLFNSYAQFKIEQYNELSEGFVAPKVFVGSSHFDSGRILSSNPQDNTYGDVEREKLMLTITKKVQEATESFKTISNKSKLMSDRIQALTEGYKKIEDTANTSVEDTRKFLEDRGVKFEP